MVDTVDESTLVESRPWSRTLVVRMLLGIATLIAACLALLPFRLLLGSAVSDLDRQAVDQAHSVATRDGLVRYAAGTFSEFGSTLWLTCLVAGFAVWWGYRRMWRRVALLVGSAACGAVLCRGIKLVIGRNRPTFDRVLAVATGSSFPSGHAMNSTIVYGTLFALTALAWSRPVRRQAAIATSALVAAIAASRVYLGVHFPSDVVVGVILGVVWLVVVGFPLRRLTEQPAEVGATSQGRAA